MRQRKGVKKEHDAEHTTHYKLQLIAFITHDVYKPHRADKPDGSKHANSRKILHGILSRLD